MTNANNLLNLSTIAVTAVIWLAGWYCYRRVVRGDRKDRR